MTLKLLLFKILLFYFPNTYSLQEDPSKQCLERENSADSIQHFYKQALTSEANHDYEKTAYYLKRGLELSEKENYFNGIKTFGHRLEYIYRARLSNYEKAEKLNNHLLQICKKRGDTTCYIIRLVNYGGKEVQKNNYIKALQFYNKALELAKKINDSLLQSDIHVSKGILFQDIGSFDEAKKEHLKSLKLTRPTDSTYRKTAYINLSYAQNDALSDSSLYYLQKASVFCSDPSKKNCYTLYNNIAWYYVKKNKPHKALEIIKTYIDFDKIELYRNDYAAILHTMGTIYQQVADYSQSISFYIKALSYYKKTGNAERVIMTLEDMAISFKKAGQEDQLLPYLKDYQYYYPLLYSSKLKKELAAIEFNNLLKEKEEEISSLTFKNHQMEASVTKTRLSIYTLLGIIVVIIGIIGYRNHITRVKFYQLNNSLAVSRLQSLRTIMNPHFLFNSFSALQNFILKKEHLKANEYMTQLSGLIRNVLSNSHSVYSDFEKEIAIIKSYIGIENGRLEEKIKVVYHIDENLKGSKLTIPSMIIQPYVENAIIHGLLPSNQEKKLTIRLVLNEKEVICIIKDNGVGRQYNEKRKHQGLSIATRNISERLAILTQLGYQNTTVSTKDLFTKEGKPKGTSVKIILPIITTSNYER
ncbi:histidine kinase [Aquimarina hainanensis]|uniref:Histidine kinase n=1 Tax=Aquimarina hainanensis TaxID=1578017 RepID=A0ABW5NAX8_9FLAO